MFLLHLFCDEWLNTDMILHGKGEILQMKVLWQEKMQVEGVGIC
jgi:hypothetical protein